MTSSNCAPSMFAQRRTRLMRQLPTGSAALFVAGHDTNRNGDVDHPFRQRSTFYYLTGFEEPDSIALLRPGHKHPFILFVRLHDPDMAIWVGSRLGVEGAVTQLKADAAYPIEQLEEVLPKLLEETRIVAFSLGSDKHLDKILTAIIVDRRANSQRGRAAIEQLIDPAPLLAKMRLIKSKEEVSRLQQAIDITGAGIEEAMRSIRPGLYEYEIQAILEAEFRRLGSQRDGFPSIVATGVNACTLHYTENRELIKDGDLVLLDVGAEVDYYGADVSRTFPANGRFSGAQRDVYEVVLAAQREAIDLIAPGILFHEVHERAQHVLTLGLRDLGVISGRMPTLIKQQSSTPYFMHGTSHWLGMDVHDVGTYRESENSIALRPGMVLTVEPGLYFTPGLRGVPRRLRGIGIRIEDDVLVTRSSHRVLSNAIPKEPEQLEAIIGF